MLTGFDAPNGVQTCTRRPRSNTPLQALMLLNDAGALEFARALADRVLADGPEDDRQRLAHAFQLCLIRPPSDGELDRLAALLDQQRNDFTADPEAAARLAPVVEDDGCTDPVERAAWTTVARVLLNLDEFVTRE